MPKKFLSVLDTIGKDFAKGLDIVLPIAQAAEPFVSTYNPAIGALYATVVGIVVQTEQKFAALGKQSGNGPQKLAEAATIAAPVVEQVFQLSGVKADSGMVNDYVSAVVGMLNATPAQAK